MSGTWEEKVANFRFPTQLGEKGPSWGTILANELKGRKEAVSMVTYDGITLPRQQGKGQRQDKGQEQRQRRKRSSARYRDA